MSSAKPNSSPKPKPKPGSLPLKEERSHGPLHPAQYAIPPFMSAEDLETPPPQRQRTPKSNIQKLKEAAKKVEALRAAVRDDAFDEWVRRYLTAAQRPSQWTQSNALYENYLRRAKTYGENRVNRALVQLELATETRFGILMRDAGFTKKRRAKGWFYPVRLKQGA